MNPRARLADIGRNAVVRQPEIFDLRVAKQAADAVVERSPRQHRSHRVREIQYLLADFGELLQL